MAQPKSRKIDLRFAYRLFYPQVPAVVCSKFGSEIAAMPATSVIPVSDNPPLVALAVGKRLGTNLVLRKSNRFSLNWLDYGQKTKQWITSLSTNSKEKINDKLKSRNIPYELEEGVPRIKGSRAFALCQIESIVDSGDHDLFIARIRQAQGKYFEENWNYAKYKPLIYLGSDQDEPMRTL
ncbi:MAG: flavin reductase family protein [Nitrososphaerales archaeon]